MPRQLRAKGSQVTGEPSESGIGADVGIQTPVFQADSITPGNLDQLKAENGKLGARRTVISRIGSLQKATQSQVPP